MAFCEIGRHSATKSQTTTATPSPENSISKQYTRSSFSVLQSIDLELASAERGVRQVAPEAVLGADRREAP